MGRKRGRSVGGPGSTKNPVNKYSENPPDFSLLASLYPSFKPFVSFSADGSRPRIDFTDYNATRELSRILLLHDHSLHWWIPDGQLCPTIPNRSNYIHWINDLLSSNIIPSLSGNNNKVKGFDIGTGANCIYPLLGASLFGWSFVASDVTDVALEWSKKNVESNPHISHLIEIRDSREKDNTTILLGVVKKTETFDFCMSNPPFFANFEEAGLNPKTSCGGTHEEMVCNGGEEAFVTRIINDSVVLRHQFRWYTSMLGKKANLKLLTSKLWEVGVTIVKTTEFVQGQTSRWGLAWSFMPTSRKILSQPVAKKSNLSFMLEGIKRQHGAADLLRSVEEFFKGCGASCKVNYSTFSVDIVASSEHCNTISNSDDVDSVYVNQSLDSSSSLQIPQDSLSFRISVFQQMPGTLLMKGSLQQKDSPLSGLFSVVFGSLEESLKSKFCR